MGSGFPPGGEPPKTSAVRTLSSDYMHWAKTLQASRYNLANSGLAAAPRQLLAGRWEDLELSGSSFYGWPQLIDAFSQHLGAPPDTIVHATGTSGANHLVMSLLLEPGDEVIVEQPTYELLTATAGHTGARIVRWPRRRENGFLPDPAELRRLLTSKTRLVVVTNLHNPSSAWLSDAALVEIARVVAGVGAHLLVDEVYLDAWRESTPPATGPGRTPRNGVQRSAFFLAGNIIVTSSLTKVYGLSGLRAGWILAPKELATRLWRLNDLFGVIPAHAAELLTVMALRNFDPFLDRSRAILEPNRDLLNRFLASRPDLETAPLRGGTVAFPRLRSGRIADLCRILRESHEATVVPGHFFDMPDHFRVGIGRERAETEEGLARLGRALDAVGRG